MDEIILETNDPRGKHISLSSETYYGHIVEESGHTEVEVSDIKETLEQPMVIYSSNRPKRDVYFAKTSVAHPKLYTKVAVSFETDAVNGDVRTAFLQEEIKGGIDTGRGPLYLERNNKLR